MSDASDSARAANLLGAFALVVAERVRSATDDATGRPTSDTAALVALTTTLGGASQDTLAAVLGLTQSGAVRLVDRLSRDGLVERRQGPDGRTSAVVVTSSGRSAARRALDGRHETIRGVLAVLDDADRDRLTLLLEELLSGLTTSRAAAYRICRLCDPAVCGHDAGRCPVTRGADEAARVEDGAR